MDASKVVPDMFMDASKAAPPMPCALVLFTICTFHCLWSHFASHMYVSCPHACVLCPHAYVFCPCLKPFHHLLMPISCTLTPMSCTHVLHPLTICTHLSCILAPIPCTLASFYHLHPFTLYVHVLYPYTHVFCPYTLMPMSYALSPCVPMSCHPSTILPLHLFTHKPSHPCALAPWKQEYINVTSSNQDQHYLYFSQAWGQVKTRFLSTHHFLVQNIQTSSITTCTHHLQVEPPPHLHSQNGKWHL